MFERIIRNPLPPGKTPRERECTEMLCAVLQNAPGIRFELLTWLGNLTGYSGIPVDELDLAIDTEQSIHRKRDDLRITGLEPDDEDDAVALLWTIEIKVGAPFHYGSSIETDVGIEEHEEEAIGENDVNQITNYDRWLSQQEAAHKAGIVLAKSDRTSGLPPNLTNTWECITWPQLAAQLRAILTEAEHLGEVDRFLGKHLLGFIHHHFGEEGRNMDDHLDFDDIAFLRAFDKVGTRAENRVYNLVEALKPVLIDSGVGLGTIYLNKTLFGSRHRIMLAQLIGNSDDWKSPYILVGIGIGGVPRLILRIEMSPKYENSQAIHALISTHFEYPECDTSWVLRPHGISSWHLLVDETPLEKLLIVDDQLGWLTEYTQNSLRALKESGLIDDIRRVVQ